MQGARESKWGLDSVQERHTNCVRTFQRNRVGARREEREMGVVRGWGSPALARKKMAQENKLTIPNKNGRKSTIQGQISGQP